MKCLEYLSTVVALCSFCLLPDCLACLVTGETLQSCEWSSWAVNCQGCCGHMNEYRATKYRTTCCDADVADTDEKCKLHCNIVDTMDTKGGSCSSYCVGAKECGGSGTNAPTVSSAIGSTTSGRNETLVTRYTKQTLTTKIGQPTSGPAFKQTVLTTKDFTGGAGATNTRTRTTSRISHAVLNTHSSKITTISTSGTTPALGSNTSALVSNTASLMTHSPIQTSPKPGTSQTLGFNSDSITSKPILTKSTTNTVVTSSKTIQTNRLTSSVTASNKSSTVVTFNKSTILSETRATQGLGINSSFTLSYQASAQPTKTAVQTLSTTPATETAGLSSYYSTTTKMLTSMISVFTNKSPASFSTNNRNTRHAIGSGASNFEMTTDRDILSNTPKSTKTSASSSSRSPISIFVSSLYQTNKTTIKSGTNRLLNTLMNNIFTTVACRTLGVTTNAVRTSKSSIRHSVSDKLQGSTSSANLIIDNSASRQTSIGLSTLSTNKEANITKPLPNTSHGSSQNGTATTRRDPGINMKTSPSVFDSTHFPTFQDRTSSYNVATNDKNSSLSHKSSFATRSSKDGDIDSVSKQKSPSESTQSASKRPLTTPTTSDIFQRESNSQSSEKLNETSTSKTEVSGSEIEDETGKISTTMLIGAGSGALLLLLLLLILFICCKKKKPEAGKIKKKKKISQIVPIDEKLYLKQKQAVEF